MIYYYVALQSKSHALLLERRFKMAGIECELTYMPREIMKDLCNLGVRFDERYLNMAAQALRGSGLPGVKLFSESVNPKYCQYDEVLY